MSSSGIVTFAKAFKEAFPNASDADVQSAWREQREAEREAEEKRREAEEKREQREAEEKREQREAEAEENRQLRIIEITKLPLAERQAALEAFCGGENGHSDVLRVFFYLRCMR
jgi:hypothetical protein